ncbi:shikimate kinase [Candidatus Tenderia electrophaga]|jgi:shikimate kinase|uniref:Shikimate kinase n=1 Tax=Candidatus Tenderia electrophaga TaxID=1748243 RepID=A0A0S2TGC1_9GAMM|nr:shikimate kinase [Candidatus Tenderia electrophaga]
MTHPSAKPKNIFIVGPMGAGKTTIGRQLARSLGWEFVDSDHEIVARTGVQIPVIFDVEGEVGFRRREKKVIDELSACQRLVLATGGGVVLDAENRRRLNERGVVVYLHASAEQLFKRTARDRNRPLLQTADPQQKIRDLLVQREPLYREVADIVMETGEENVRAVVRKLMGHLKRFGIVNESEQSKLR